MMDEAPQRSRGSNGDGGIASRATFERLVALMLEDAMSEKLALARDALLGDAELCHWAARSGCDLSVTEGTSENTKLDDPALDRLARWLCQCGGDDFETLNFAADSGEAIASLPVPLARLADRLRRLEQLESQFQETLEREKLASLCELAYGLSHEINNPLANISTRAQALLRDEPDPERRRKLATINAQAFRAHEMIADMMLFAKPPRLQSQPVSVAELLERVVRESTVAADAQRTQLRTVFPDDAESWQMEADPTHLAESLRALIRNSLESLQSGGWIELSVASDAQPDSAGHDWLRIAVRDNGPGMTEQVLRHLFDPYFSGREAGRGLGLGLSKCWTVVRLHGGRIDVQSEPRRETTFTIQLPMLSTAESPHVH